jgi:hypothetical protein
LTTPDSSVCWRGGRVGAEAVERRALLREQVGEGLELAQLEASPGGDRVQGAARLRGQLLGAARVGKGAHALVELLVTAMQRPGQVDLEQRADALGVLAGDGLPGERPRPGGRSQPLEAGELGSHPGELARDQAAGRAARGRLGREVGRGGLIHHLLLGLERGGVGRVAASDHAGHQVALELQLVDERGRLVAEPGQLSSLAQRPRAGQGRGRAHAGQHQERDRGDHQDRYQLRLHSPVAEPQRRRVARPPPGLAAGRVCLDRVHGVGPLSTRRERIRAPRGSKAR